MATVKQVEARIRKIEDFDVRILYLGGADVRSDRTGLPQYSYERAMKNATNVRGWIDGRFRVSYPGFGVEVLLAGGRKAHGNMLLGTVRDSYLDD